MAENPFAASGPVGRMKRSVEIGVDVETDHVRFPLDGVNMKVARKALARPKFEDGGQVASWSRGAGTMQGAVDRSGFLADIFHDVDLATLRPTGRGNVFAQHPERGPHPLSFWDFYACLETAVGLREKILRFEAGGGVVARDAVSGGIRFLLCGDDEIAFFDVGVFLEVRVGLEFVVAP